MARNENVPFGRGETFFGGATANATDGAQYEGKEYVFEDVDYSSASSGAKPNRTHHPVRVKIVRNVSGVALLPKRLVRFKETGSTYGGQVDGYATGDGNAQGFEEGYPLDEFLPAAGLANNDLGFVVVDGPAMCTTTFDNSAGTDIAVGDLVAVAKTAAASTGITAGRIEGLSLVNHTQPNATTQSYNIRQYKNAIGVGLTAKTTAQTNADIFVYIKKW